MSQLPFSPCSKWEKPGSGIGIKISSLFLPRLRLDNATNLRSALETGGVWRKHQLAKTRWPLWSSSSGIKGNLASFFYVLMKNWGGGWCCLTQGLDIPWSFRDYFHNPLDIFLTAFQAFCPLSLLCWDLRCGKHKPGWKTNPISLARRDLDDNEH